MPKSSPRSRVRGGFFGFDGFDRNPRRAPEEPAVVSDARKVLSEGIEQVNKILTEFKAASASIQPYNEKINPTMSVAIYTAVYIIRYIQTVNSALVAFMADESKIYAKYKAYFTDLLHTERDMFAIEMDLLQKIRTNCDQSSKFGTSASNVITDFLTVRNAYTTRVFDLLDDNDHINGQTAYSAIDHLNSIHSQLDSIVVTLETMKTMPYEGPAIGGRATSRRPSSKSAGRAPKWLPTSRTVVHKGKSRKVWRSAKDASVHAVKCAVKTTDGARRYRYEKV